MDAVLREAQSIVESLQDEKPRLEREKARLEDELAKTERELEKADLAAKRLASFQVHANGREQCPRCWIENEVATDLTPVPGDDRHDKFRCRTCDFELSAPV